MTITRNELVGKLVAWVKTHPVGQGGMLHGVLYVGDISNSMLEAVVSECIGAAGISNALWQLSATQRKKTIRDMWIAIAEDNDDNKQPVDSGAEAISGGEGIAGEEHREPGQVIAFPSHGGARKADGVDGVPEKPGTAS